MTQSASSNPFRVEIQAARVIPARPAWVPPAGYFADVPMINYPIDVTPAIYTASDMNAAFDHWTGSAVLYDYSSLGAQVYQGAGHETSPGSPNIQLTLALDFSTLKWSVNNVPAAVNASSSFDLGNGTAPDGTPYNGHTYLGVQEMPTAWGGGAKGSLVQMLTAGALYRQTVHVADVSKTTNGYKELTLTGQTGDAVVGNQLKFNSGSIGGSYPISAQDNGRKGWWLDVNGTHDYTLFISATGSVTQTPAIHGNNEYASLILSEKLGLLILVNGGREGAARSMRIRDLATGVTSSVGIVGSLPSAIKQGDGSFQYRPELMGLQWVDELGCIVGIDYQTTPPTICKIVPPATNPASNSWSAQAVPLSHWDAGDPNGSQNIRMPTNGSFSKFRWVKTLGAFVMASSSTSKPQVFSI